MSNQAEQKNLPLSFLQGKTLGPYHILLETKPLKYRQGWTHFSLFLQESPRKGNSKKRSIGKKGTKLVLEGIHSQGGRDVKGWMEVGNYFPLEYSQGPSRMYGRLEFEKESLDQQLFQLLSRSVPPGGHFMFAYEIFYESPLHEKTLMSLGSNIPPICTAQGALLFFSGFRFIKNWYLSEGGHEGPSKLWGEKPLDADDLCSLDAKSFFEVLFYLSRKPNQRRMDLEFPARQRALNIMAEFCLTNDLSPLREKIMDHYKNGLNEQDILRVARQTCRIIEEALKTSRLRNRQIKKYLEEISENCFDSYKLE